MSSHPLGFRFSQFTTPNVTIGSTTAAKNNAISINNKIMHHHHQQQQQQFQNQQQQAIKKIPVPIKQHQLQQQQRLQSPQHQPPSSIQPQQHHQPQQTPLPLAPPQYSSATNSLSGSETDISTSNENLSMEQRYVLRHTPRVEPQGQENLQETAQSGNENQGTIYTKLSFF